uniref:Uncharacterized protein n=1 Tax=Arundo donax TaxID=35708 RepID=A0A0A9DC87_ARUDO
MRHSQYHTGRVFHFDWTCKQPHLGFLDSIGQHLEALGSIYGANSLMCHQPNCMTSHIWSSIKSQSHALLDTLRMSLMQGISPYHQIPLPKYPPLLDENA